MNPYLILGVAGAFVAVSAIAGVQSYRLQGAQGTIALLELEKSEQVKDQLEQAAANQRNKERTDAQYKLDMAAARTVGVRVGSDRQFVKPAPTGGSETELACFSADELNRELTAWAGRVAERFSGAAIAAEEVAAAYRSCKAWALSLP